MKIILSPQCESLTGTLGRDFGYAIRKQHGGFYSIRCSNQRVPRDGHWRFIVLCAQLAQNKLHIADIIVSSIELGKALNEARIGYLQLFKLPLKDTYNARDVLSLNDKIFVNCRRIASDPVTHNP